MYTIGFDVGGTNLVAGLIDESLAIVARIKREVGVGRTAEALCADMSDMAHELTAGAGLRPADIGFIGIGVPGTLDNERGLIIHTVNMPFRNTPVRDWLRRTWDCPILLGNDADCAAVGEFYAGGGREYRSMVLLTLGTGVGSGVMLDGKLIPGTEYGHTVIVPDGTLCTCGRRGCLERYASATGLKAMTVDAMRAAPDSLLWKQCNGDLARVSGRTAFDAKRQGDAVAAQVVEQYLKSLAIGIVNLVSIFRPEAICLGGGVSNEADDAFLHPLSVHVKAELPHFAAPDDTTLVKAKLGNDAGMVGAALLGKLV